MVCICRHCLPSLIALKLLRRISEYKKNICVCKKRKTIIQIAITNELHLPHGRNNRSLYCDGFVVPYDYICKRRPCFPELNRPPPTANPIFTDNNLSILRLSIVSKTSPSSYSFLPSVWKHQQHIIKISAFCPK